jgi:hypothetical protein
MLMCLPRSICSWGFVVTGGLAGASQVEFNFATEQGRIIVGGEPFVVRKHGWLSGRWSLERGADTWANACKPNPFLRSFELQSEDLRLKVRAASPLLRRFIIVRDAWIIGNIRPAHAFTRRASIVCDASVPEAVQLFSFWLAVLTWRRAARSNGGGGAA